MVPRRAMSKIREWRKAEGLAAKAAAKLIGVSRVHLFRLESGSRAVTPQLAVKIEAISNRSILRSDLRPDLWPEPPLRVAQRLLSEAEVRG